MNSNDVNVENQTLEETKKKDKEEEISLIDLLAVLLRYKKMIISITVAAMVFILGYSVISLKLPPEKSYMPNEYTPKALLLINSSSTSSAMSQYSSLASLAGINLNTSSGGISYSSLATFLISTEDFLDSVVDKFDLINLWEIEDHVRANSRKTLQKMLSASFDSDTGVLTISCTDKDPQLAADIVRFTVEYMEKRFDELGIDKNKIKKENLEKNIQTSLDELTRLQQQQADLARQTEGAYGGSIPSIVMESGKLSIEIKAQEEIYSSLKGQLALLNVEMQSESPVLQVLQEVSIPDEKSGPSRGKLCIIVTFAAFFISIFLAFLLNAIKNVKADPEAMKKLNKKDNKKDNKNKKAAVTSAIAVLFVSLSLIAPAKVYAQAQNEEAAKNEIAADVGLRTNAQLAMTSPDYRVTAGDIYTLAYAAGSTPVNYTMFIDSSYKMSVSNLATLDCSGLTFTQLKHQVEDIVKKNYPMGAPQFILTQPSEFTVRIIGEVSSAQEKNAWALSRLSTVIGSSLTTYSSTRNIEITSISGKTRTYDLFLAKRFGDLSNDPYLRPGDVITIKRYDRRVTINGCVERPGTYELLEGENLQRLVTYYGNNFTKKADLSRISLSRITSTKSENDSLNVNSLDKIQLSKKDYIDDYKLNDSDEIYIYSIADSQPVFYIEGAVFSETDNELQTSSRMSITFNEGDTLDSILRNRTGLFTATSDTSIAYILRDGEKIPVELDNILHDATYNSNFKLKNLDILVIPFRQYFVTVSGAVKNPGRFPYIPDRNYDYYVSLAGGATDTNWFNAVKMTDRFGNEMKQDDEIGPETNIYVKSNSFIYYLNTIAAPIATILSIISSFILALTYAQNL